MSGSKGDNEALGLKPSLLQPKLQQLSGLQGLGLTPGEQTGFIFLTSLLRLPHLLALSCKDAGSAQPPCARWSVIVLWVTPVTSITNSAEKPGRATKFDPDEDKTVTLPAGREDRGHCRWTLPAASPAFLGMLAFGSHHSDADSKVSGQIAELLSAPTPG